MPRNTITTAMLWMLISNGNRHSRRASLKNARRRDVMAYGFGKAKHNAGFVWNVAGKLVLPPAVPVIKGERRAISDRGGGGGICAEGPE